MSGNLYSDRILILDFGSQYTQLIARRVRELGVYCELHPYEVSADFIRNFAPKGIILSGGPDSVLEENSPRAVAEVFALGCPVLGICYGMQTMAYQLGGKLAQGKDGTGEFGNMRVNVTAFDRLLDAIPLTADPSGQQWFEVWMSHGDCVTEVPPDFQVLGYSSNGVIAIMASTQRPFYGVQFHPEVTHTPHGKQLIANFVHTICQCKPLWQPSAIVEQLITQIRQQVGNEAVILGLSGGVDSSVLAALLQRAIGNQLTCVFVDTGLLRLNERQQVEQTFQEHLGIRLITVDATERFMQALAGVTDPEEKRRIIGREFVAVFELQAAQLPAIRWLAQGTIYPDVIESAGTSTGKVQLIKTHHNVGGLPQHMRLKVLEPLRELFKDEVRRIGQELGVPSSILRRHPFPGPGLGVRVLGEVKSEYVEKLKHADAIFIEELRAYGLYEQVSQAFAVFLPVASVGVTGDGRRYEPIIALRAVTTTDFMTAEWAYLPYDLLSRVSLRIVNEVPGISRVVYDISGKPPATIEWE